MDSCEMTSLARMRALYYFIEILHDSMLRDNSGGI
jgi:hypothetical protein